MSKHSFYRDLQDKAKKEGKALVAYSYRGKFQFDCEGPRDHDFALKLTEFVIHVMTSQDASLIPAVPKKKRPTQLKKA